VLDTRRQLVGLITRKDVMPETIAARIQLSESEWEKVGDYARACSMVEATIRSEGADLAELTERSRVDQAKERIAQRLKLAEMYWRYRVVDEGKSPRTEALAVLDGALELLTRARADEVGSSGLRSEEGQIKFMQGVTRLIHNADREEDELIRSLLQEALALHTALDEHERIGEVLNSLGSLHQKGGRLREAEEVCRPAPTSLPPG